MAAMNATHEADWLVPSEALSRFQPQGLELAAEHTGKSDKVRYGYQVGDLQLLIGEGVGSEVLSMPPVFPVPNAPVWLTGLVNLRSQLIPVFDLDGHLLDEHTTRKDEMLLVLGKGESAAAFVIDGHPKSLRELRQAEVPAASLPAALSKHVRQAWLDGEALWLEFDHEGLLGDMSGVQVQPA